MALFDLLGRSWAMGVIWNLNRGPCTFRELQTRCNMVSLTTLNSRLKELTEAYLIERCLEGYQLTSSGEELFSLLSPLGKWSGKWAEKF
ncbi:helix-turn-helix transcriptional regulator [Fulvivirga sp. 29W222]|uniref:Helix-turn-helix transcriptional regulator n=2 Tax=Fulvivirga marina TaxID=2494733 RepID=A0A937G0S0_9BACT|nr:helix-turn-helix transcriptional regulator [Fulvivirga marina]